jgi:hypothetical protein
VAYAILVPIGGDAELRVGISNLGNPAGLAAVEGFGDGKLGGFELCPTSLNLSAVE